MCNTSKVVCFCNTNRVWGGGEKWHYEAAVSLAQRGWKVHVICLAGSPLHKKALKEKTLKVFALRVGKLSFLNPLKRFFARSYFSHYCISSVILNLPSDLKLFGPSAKKAGVTNIIYRRGSDIPVKNSFLNRFLYQHILTRVIANSYATAGAILKNNAHLIDKEKITILYNGIDADNFDKALAKGTILSGIQQPEENATISPLIIGNAGRLNEQKGQHLLLYLGKLLTESGTPYKIVIAGTGEREEELISLAKQLGIEKNVIFTGFLEDLSSFWKSIDVFFLSSLWEGFGFVLVEAMLAKKPLIAFNVSNIPELVRDQQNGLLLPFPKNNDLSEAHKAIELLYNNHLRQQMGEYGRSFAINNFSQSSRIDELEALLSH